MYPPVCVLEKICAACGLNYLDQAVLYSIRVHHPITIVELQAFLGVSAMTLRHSIARLVEARWLGLIPHGHSKRPILLVPHEFQDAVVSDFQRRYLLAANRGEFLAKGFLDFRVLTNDYVDNARPEFLTSPGNHKPMELDRWFPKHKVGYEVNGLQHYQTTDRYPDPRELAERKDRDAAKIGHCLQAGITLVIITPATIDVESMEKLLPPCLPISPLRDEGPFFKSLKQMCESYKKATLRARE